MNGFGEHSEDAFGPAKGGIVSSFDAFRMFDVLATRDGSKLMAIFQPKPRRHISFKVATPPGGP
jgi:hypothetical protein